MELFLDSGAHSLYNIHMINVQHKHGYSWSEAPEFWEYVDKYAAFVKENKDFLETYVTVDVIFNPEQTYKVLKYLENTHGLSPLPVVHYGADTKWIKKYLDEGYDYIGIGGLGQEATKSAYFAWADRVFSIICDTPDKLPKAKTHGFAMTSIELMRRYPWYSVDSTTWVMTGAMGSIFVPQYKNNKWNYLTKASWKIDVSNKSPSKKIAGQHIDTLSPNARNVILRYVHEQGYKLGKSKFKKENQAYTLKKDEKWFDKKPKNKHTKRTVEIIVEPGISNTFQPRLELNALYFLNLEKALPPWPQPFIKQTKMKKFTF